METTSDKVLAAAFRLFSQHGFKKVSMSDIAAAASISRPTLYAAFSNKEAIFAALLDKHMHVREQLTDSRLPRAKTLAARLTVVLDVWLIEPFSEVAGSPGAAELIQNTSLYAPSESKEFYRRMEARITAVIAEELPARRKAYAEDLAHIVVVAARGLKSSAVDVGELKRHVGTLISMVTSGVP